MARRPFFTGDYGSALGRIDTRPIIEAGRAQGQMYANLGAQAAKAIETYQLNKEEREKAEAAFQGDVRRLLEDKPEELEAMKQDRVIGPALKRIEEGKGTIKDFNQYNAYRAADKEATIEKLKLDNARTQKGMLEVQAELEKRLADPTVRKALANAKTAEDQSLYAKSIASADYAKSVADTALTRAQTEYYDAMSKAKEKSETYTPGQRVDIKGISGNKVSFVWTGNSLQPLNDKISQKAIEEAMIQGLDQAQLQVYLDDNYDYDEETKTYTFKSEGNMFGFGRGVKNPMMEQAITLLGLRSKVISPSEEPTDTQSEDPSAPSTIVPPEAGQTDIRQLAQEALNDPEATEEEKLKAREILER